MTMAMNIDAVMPIDPSGFSKPSVNSSPPPISAMAAMNAQNEAGRSPDAPNHPAIPCNPGPPNQPNSFCDPWPMNSSPSTTRRISSPMSTIDIPKPPEENASLHLLQPLCGKVNSLVQNCYAVDRPG